MVESEFWVLGLKSVGYVALAFRGLGAEDFRGSEALRHVRRLR